MSSSTREIEWALDDIERAMHPTDRRLTGIYGTIWSDDLGNTSGQVHQCNVTVVAASRRPAASK